MSQPTIETRKILEVMNDGDIVNYAMANTEILYDIFGNLSCEEIIMYTGMKNLHSPKSNRKLGTDSLLDEIGEEEAMIHFDLMTVAEVEENYKKI